MQVLVKFLTGSTLTLHVDLDWPVWCVKKCIEDIEGIPMDQQRMVYAAAGCRLEDLRNLREYNVGKGSILHLVLRLNGD